MLSASAPSLASGGRRRLRALASSALLIVLLALVTAGCAGGGPSPTGSLTVSGAWARAASAGSATAVYLTITNNGPADSLTKASVPVGMASIHRTMAGDSGMMGMEPVDKMAIPSGGTVTLEPGGFHIMVEGLTAAVEAGTTIDVTLTFEHAGQRTVKAEVRAN